MSEENESTTGMVTRLSPRLTGKQRRFLRSLAHDLHPIVQVGQKGISEGLIENFQAALLAHELVKVKVHGGDEILEVAEALHKATGAQLAQQIGFMLVFYQPHPKKPTITLPR